MHMEANDLAAEPGHVEAAYLHVRGYRESRGLRMSRARVVGYWEWE
jgi:hypothetical protein